MENFILIVILSVILGSAAFAVYRANKRGKGCIGCPYAKQCEKKSTEKCGNCSQYKYQAKNGDLQ